MQKIRKKYQTVKAVGPELPHARTYARTYESEFIGSFRSLKTSGEPIINNKILIMKRGQFWVHPPGGGGKQEFSSTHH